MPVKPTITDPERRRRRKRRHERQAIIYGLLSIALIAVAVYAVAILTGNIQAPFDRVFTQADNSRGVLQPCLPQPQVEIRTEITADGEEVETEFLPGGIQPTPYNEVVLRVYNASGEPGIAGAASTVLEGRGFTVLSTATYPAGLVFYSEVRFGIDSIADAYTVASQFPSMTLVLDDRTDGTVDVIMGEQFQAPLSVEDIVENADGPYMTNYANCVDADQITPVAALVRAPEEVYDPFADVPDVEDIEPDYGPDYGEHVDNPEEGTQEGAEG